MKLTKKMKLLGLATAAITIAAALLVRRSTPSYQGKSIKEWFYRTGDSAVREDPELDAKAFHAMSGEAVPFLVRRLDASPSKRTEILLAKFSPNVGTHYRQQKEMWQNRAAYLLGEIGPAAKSALPDLSSATNSPSWFLRGSATVAIMKITEEPIEPLIEKLKDTDDYRSWYENAMMVAAFGPRAELAIPILLDALQHSNIIIQAHALITLGRIRRQPDRCIPAIVPFLSSRDAGIRQKAIGALLSFGTNAITAKAAIQKAVNDPDPWVRNRAELEMESLKRTEEEQPTAGLDRVADPPESAPSLSHDANQARQ